MEILQLLPIIFKHQELMDKLANPNYQRKSTAVNSYQLPNPAEFKGFMLT